LGDYRTLSLGHIPLPGFPEGLFPLRGLDSIPISDNLYGIATVASIILLFVSGLETDISLLLRYSLAGTLIGIGGVIFSFSSCCCRTFLSPQTFFRHHKSFLGVISTATSVGITARILSEKRKMDYPKV
jgi:Kef-type K+ transport system membrane component KefB